MIFPFSLKEREIEMKKRVYTLYRVSTKGQVEKDDIPMQKEACRNFAESQGWEIVKEFSEKGVSGFKKSAKDRDELQKIQQAAMEGKFDILLVFMFDRLGRRDDETPFIVEWFTKQGIEVWSVNEGQQRFDTHVDKLMNYIRYWQASGESLKTSVRTRTRLEQLTGEGHYTGGTVAFGYKRVRLGRVNKKNQEVCDLVIDEAEAEIVRLIFHKYVYEGYGAQKLSHYLYEQGVVGRNNKNIPNTSIVRMIKNKGYTGYLINGAVETECPQLRIIEPELFEQAQELRQARTCERGGTSLGTSSKALLTGLVYCADCGERRYNHRRRYNLADGTERILSYFNCSTYTLTIQREKTLCCSHYINNDALNELLLMTIRTVSKYALRDEEDFIRRIRSTTEVKQANEAKALQRSIAKAKKRSAELDVLIKRLYESYVLEKLPEKRYEALSAEYEQEQAELEEAIAQDQAKLDAYQADSTNVEAFIQLAKKYRDVPELTPGMVNEFVDKIIVHAPVKDGVERTQQVDIYLRFIGLMDIPLEEPELTPEQQAEQDKIMKKRAMYRKKYLRRKELKAAREAAAAQAEEEPDQDTKKSA